MRIATLSEKEIIITLIALSLLLLFALVVGYLIKAVFGTSDTVKTRMKSLEQIAGYYLRLQQKKDAKVFDEL